MAAVPSVQRQVRGPRLSREDRQDACSAEGGRTLQPLVGPPADVMEARRRTHTDTALTYTRHVTHVPVQALAYSAPRGEKRMCTQEGSTRHDEDHALPRDM